MGEKTVPRWVHVCALCGAELDPKFIVVGPLCLCQRIRALAEAKP